MDSDDSQRSTPLRNEERHDRRWSGISIWVPLLAALVGAVVGLAGGVYVADRQIAESRREVDRQLADSRREIAHQISADRVGRVSDERANTYGQFVSAVDRHLAVIGGPTEQPIRDADEDIFAALRLIQLRGSATAYRRADAIAARARELTNAAIEAIQQGGRTQVAQTPFFAQQAALNRFVARVQPEVRR